MIPSWVNRYFPKWLGPLFVGVYVALYSPSVFDNSVSLGTFLAMIHVMKDISSEFAEVQTADLLISGEYLVNIWLIYMVIIYGYIMYILVGGLEHVFFSIY